MLKKSFAVLKPASHAEHTIEEVVRIYRKVHPDEPVMGETDTLCKAWSEATWRFRGFTIMGLLYAAQDAELEAVRQVASLYVLMTTCDALLAPEHRNSSWNRLWFYARLSTIAITTGWFPSELYRGSLEDMKRRGIAVDEEMLALERSQKESPLGKGAL